MPKVILQPQQQREGTHSLILKHLLEDQAHLGCSPGTETLRVPAQKSATETLSPVLRGGSPKHLTGVSATQAVMLPTSVPPQP